MNARPILLGITGNIASGKSAVRQYLENEGALTIDADLLAQSTYFPGGPAYQPILDTFGDDLCFGDGQINRSRLGRIVFADPSAMQKLEAIIHPLVTEQILAITARAEVGLVVVEAIKLFEAGIHEKCDAVWTVAADENVRKERLINTRGLTEADAMRRIRSQSPEEEKIRRSDYVIYTDKDFRFTYEQTMQGLAMLNPDLPEEVVSFTGEVFRPLRPMDFDNSTALFSRVFSRERTEDDLFRSLSRQTILAGFNENEITTLAFWKAELFLSLIHNIIPYGPKSEEAKHTLEVLAMVAHAHLCEALYISRELIHPAAAKALGYMPGDYFPPELNPFAVNNFLRKYGLMPEEVFVKHDL